MFNANRAGACAAFIALDFGLLALTMCTRSPPPQPEPRPSDQAPSASAVALATPDASTRAADVDASEPLVGVPAGAKRSCRDLDRAIDDMFAMKNCRADGDCVTRAPYCACGIPIAKAAVPRLDALTLEWQAKHCATSGPPRPCATCPMPPVPACVGGVCVPKR